MKLFLGVTGGLVLAFVGLMLLITALSTDPHALAVRSDPAGLVDSENNATTILLLTGGLGLLALGGGVSLIIWAARSNKEKAPGR